MKGKKKTYKKTSSSGKKKGCGCGCSG